MTTLLWGVLPYVAVALLVAGLVWRYRYDKFGWTTRSSQVYESKLLNIASPAFHYGILFVLAGHIVGLFIPMSWTDKLGISEHTYHLFSLYGGTAAASSRSPGSCCWSTGAGRGRPSSVRPPPTTSSCTWCCSARSRWA